MMNSLLPAPTRAASRLLAAMTTPLVPDDMVALVAPLSTRHELRAKVLAVLPETRTAATIVLRPGRTWTPHVPGQYLRMGVDVDGVRHWRAYSITSVPSRDRVSITVKLVDDGIVSTHLLRRTRPGHLVHLEQASGDFVLPDDPTTPTLFVTAGSGITPVMGMLRSHAGEGRDVVVVHSAPNAAETIFASELQQLADDRRITLHLRHTHDDGRLTADDLARLVPDIAERILLACGPAGLLDDLDRAAAQRGWDLPTVERFQPVRCRVGEGGTATFAATGREVQVDGATSLLDAGEAADVLMPSGCRMGICFGCVAPLRDGAVRDLRTGELTEAVEGDPVSIQTCVSTAAGDCQIDL